jgi:hypothetical protein
LCSISRSTRSAAVTIDKHDTKSALPLLHGLTANHDEHEAHDDHEDHLVIVFFVAS